MIILQKEKKGGGSWLNLFIRQTKFLRTTSKVPGPFWRNANVNNKKIKSISHSSPGGKKKTGLILRLIYAFIR